MQKIIFGLALLILVAGGLWWYLSQTEQVFFIDTRDTVTNWDFQGSHTDGGEFEQRAQDEIAKLAVHLNDAATEPPDYQLYVGLAGQYTLLGDGRRSFEYLQKALAIESETTGLAWHNMGALMERLGALNSARDAYEHAVTTQPHIDAYHSALLNFLIKHFPEDEQALESALVRAEAQFDDDTFVRQARVLWLEAKGDYQAAVTLWKELRAEASPEVRANIDAKIRDLEANL